MKLRALLVVTTLFGLIFAVPASADESRHSTPSGAKSAQKTSPFVGRWVWPDASGGPYVFNIARVLPNGEARGRFSFLRGSSWMLLSDKTSGVQMIVRIKGNEMTGKFDDQSHFDLKLKGNKLVGSWTHPNGWKFHAVFVKE